MRFSVESSLTYEINSPATFILNIQALNSSKQKVLEESLTIEPECKIEALEADSHRNRFVKINTSESGLYQVDYKATVETSYTIVHPDQIQSNSIAALDPLIFPYLYPSRYCQSDKLYRFADKTFGFYASDLMKVNAIVDWIYYQIDYVGGISNSQTSAFETITDKAGVCRDFAHLGIALCRALTIPARYFTCYAYKLKPSDFHACFEAYLGGQWILFDATKLAPLNGLVKIATGMDAAETAIASIFGDVVGKSITVKTAIVDEGFNSLFYDKNSSAFLSYS